MRHPFRPAPSHRALRGLGLAVVAAAAAAVAACGSSTPTTPTTPTPTTVTETYDGTLTVNGAVTQPFAVQTAGTIVATVVSLDPTDAVIGLSIGTWNGTTCSVGGLTFANDAATVGASVSVSATATGNYCARVYDAGKLTGPVGYQVTVVHY